MARNEIEKRIETLEGYIFCLWCKDHWFPKDWEDKARWERELAGLKEELKAMI